MYRAIDKLLNRFGYYKAEMPKGSQLSESDVTDMIQAYSGGEPFSRFLRDLCINDINLYFQATNEEDRRAIRGAYQRTKYFLALIKKANEKRKRKP